MNPESGDLEGLISFDKSLGGVEDTVIDESNAYAYFLTNVNKLGVLDLQTGQLLQQFTYGSLENRPTWTGMAMWSSEAGQW